MFHSDLLISNLTSPAVICFLIGAIAALAKSDLRVPPQAYEIISLYLLFAIGLKGGMALSATTFYEILYPVAATLLLGVLTPILAYVLARKFGKLDVPNAAAIAAHFGSVSAVTFMASLNFAEQSEIRYEGFMTALLVIMEIPGIVVALSIATMFINKKKVRLGRAIKDALRGKSIILLAGGLLVGLIGDREGVSAITNVFVGSFQGVLVFFLLEMGVVAATRLKEVRSAMPFMLIFGTLVPILFGLLGAVIGSYVGLSEGGTAILATMAASASYIAAPAAVKMALPDANPGLYLTTSISITLPFNIVIGIPIYFELAKFLV